MRAGCRDEGDVERIADGGVENAGHVYNSFSMMIERGGGAAEHTFVTQSVLEVARVRGRRDRKPTTLRSDGDCVRRLTAVDDFDD